MAIYIPPEWHKRATELWRQPGAGLRKIYEQLASEGMPIPFRKVRQIGVDAGVDVTARFQEAGPGRPPADDATGKKWSPIRDRIRARLAKNPDEDVAVLAKSIGCRPRTVYHYKREWLDEQKKKEVS